MTAPKDDRQSNVALLDRPSEGVPSIDQAPGNQPARAKRPTNVSRDRAQHRVYHGLYEDMLN